MRAGPRLSHSRPRCRHWRLRHCRAHTVLSQRGVNGQTMVACVTVFCHQLPRRRCHRGHRDFAGECHELASISSAAASASSRLSWKGLCVLKEYIKGRKGMACSKACATCSQKPYTDMNVASPPSAGRGAQQEACVCAAQRCGAMHPLGTRGVAAQRTRSRSMQRAYVRAQSSAWHVCWGHTHPRTWWSHPQALTQESLEVGAGDPSPVDRRAHGGCSETNQVMGDGQGWNGRTAVSFADPLTGWLVD